MEEVVAPTDESHDEEMVRALRSVLAVEEPAPRGLRSRYRAGIAASQVGIPASQVGIRRPGWISMVVLAAVVFVVLAAVAPTHASADALGLLALGVTGYVLSSRLFAGGAHVRMRGGGGGRSPGDPQ